MSSLWYDNLDNSHKHLLATYRFDLAAFERKREQLILGDISHAKNKIHNTIVPSVDDDFVFLPTHHDDANYQHLYNEGIKQIKAGNVAVIILNGGMATRFGGIVKGTVHVSDKESFLQLKLNDVRTWQNKYNIQIPVFILNSFATHEKTQEHLNNQYDDITIYYLTQSIAPRLTRHGEVYFNEYNQPSFYAPGHGDTLHTWRQDQIAHGFSTPEKMVCISNVDNIKGLLNPAIIGAHSLSHCPLSVEIVKKNIGDVGGAPAWINGKLQIIEGFRFPSEYDQSQLTTFSTNNFVVNAHILREKYDLHWFYVEKKINNETIVQLEQLFNELSAFVKTNFIVVPRDGSDSRFFPVKTQDDLLIARKILQP